MKKINKQTNRQTKTNNEFQSRENLVFYSLSYLMFDNSWHVAVYKMIAYSKIESEAVLIKLSKHELIELLLDVEGNMETHIALFIAY